MSETPSKSSLVLTIIGTDRPGLVDTLAKVVTAGGGNWLESRLSHLGGKFAGIVHVEVAEESVDSLMSALSALETDGLRVLSELDEETATEAGWVSVQLTLVGNDHPGIVRSITHALAEKDVNVEEFETEYTSAPMSGGMIFRAVARLKLPPDLPIQQLREHLEGLASDLMVEIELREVNR